MRVRPFSVELRRPLSTARGDLSTRRGFLVEVVVDGTVGVGEATPLPGWTESYDACAAALDGIDDPRAALQSEALAGAPAARHGVELALADARARIAGESLAASLAAAAAGPAETVPVNATVGDGPPAETAADAGDAADAGYDCVKVKVGARDVATDAERLHAVRERVGERVELRADANGTYTLPEAREFLASVADVGLAYLEQPLPAEDVAGHARLRAETGTPVAVDESLAGHDAASILDAGAADVLVCKPMALGGVDRTLETAERAAAAGVDVVLTTTIDAVVARTGAVHAAAALDCDRACGLATAQLLGTDLTADPAPVEDGRVAVPAGPGLAGSAFEGLFAREE